MTKGITVKKNAKPKKVAPKKKITPKKVAPKKKITPNKVAPNKKEGQTQTQSVTVNIDSQGKKSITRSSKQQSQPRKQPIKQPQTISPVIQSYNQPVFNKQTPPSLASSILATQLTPKVVAQEKKEESTITRALQEQITNVDTEPERVKNDLEKTKAKPKEKENPIISVPDGSINITQPIIQPPLFFSSFKKINKESRDPVKHALLGQLLDDKGNDTEEIAEIIQSSVTEGLLSPDIPNPLRRLDKYKSILSSTQPTEPNPLYKQETTKSLLSPPEEEYLNQAYAEGVEETKDEEILQPEPEPEPEPEQVFIPHFKNYNFINKLSDYTQPQLENKYDEVINEQLTINKIIKEQLANIGLEIPPLGITAQFLMKHNDILTEDLIDLMTYLNDLESEQARIEKKITNIEAEKPTILQPPKPPPTILQQQEQPPTILQPIQKEASILQESEPIPEPQQILQQPTPPPPILQPIQKEASILQENEDQTIEPPSLLPSRRAEEEETPIKENKITDDENTPTKRGGGRRTKTEADYNIIVNLQEVKAKFMELKNQGLISTTQRRPGTTTNKDLKELLAEIHQVEGYNYWGTK